MTHKLFNITVNESEAAASTQIGKTRIVTETVTREFWIELWQPGMPPNDACTFSVFGENEFDALRRFCTLMGF